MQFRLLCLPIIIVFFLFLLIKNVFWGWCRMRECVGCSRYKYINVNEYIKLYDGRGSFTYRIQLN